MGWRTALSVRLTGHRCGILNTGRRASWRSWKWQIKKWALRLWAHHWTCGRNGLDHLWALLDPEMKTVRLNLELIPILTGRNRQGNHLSYWKTLYLCLSFALFPFFLIAVFHLLFYVLWNTGLYKVAHIMPHPLCLRFWWDILNNGAWVGFPEQWYFHVHPMNQDINHSQRLSHNGLCTKLTLFSTAH